MSKETITHVQVGYEMDDKLADVIGKQTILAVDDPAPDMERFILTMIDLTRLASDMPGDPLFRVRMDVDVDRSIRPEIRTCRILVRPVEPPIMGDEMTAVVAVAHHRELACSITNAGIVIHTPDNPPIS